jgi:hypothetical protein
MDYGADWRILKYQSQFSGSPGMAFVLQEVYSPVVEESMRIVYHTLSEKDRRRYVAVEALKLGWGGQTYLASVVGCWKNTVLPNDRLKKRWPAEAYPIAINNLNISKL